MLLCLPLFEPALEHAVFPHTPYPLPLVAVGAGIVGAGRLAFIIDTSSMFVSLLLLSLDWCKCSGGMAIHAIHSSDLQPN